MTKEEIRLEEIEKRLSKLNHSLEALIPIWSQVDRQVRSKKEEMDRLEAERLTLTEGQFIFDENGF